jgi:UDP-N-acetylmuramoyl-L-alanyl-D-glutamate--2,6-diaminopimelate ligase
VAREFTCAADAARWLTARVSGSLHADSRALHAGDGFLAWPGQASDGRRFVPAALAAGAAACLVEAEGLQACGNDAVFSDERVAALPGLKAAAGEIADAFWGAPSARLDLIAVTGTNGKTSTAWWTAQALTALGRRCGVVGTLGIGEPPPATGLPPAASASDAAQPLAGIEATGLTTPDALSLHAAFRRFADAGLQACALEASSIGLVDDRLTAARIDVAVFTNFTRDHLDFHGDMAAYWAAKRRLFDWPGLRCAVLNIDDAQGAALAAVLQGGTIDVWTVSLARPARLTATALRQGGDGLAFDLVEGQDEAAVSTALVGDYNASNLLGVAAALRALGLPLADVAQALSRLTPVPGRLQRVPGSGDEVEVLVDYAHTPDALEKTLAALRPRAAARGGALVAVFGCGGNRDATKRPLMGAIAERLADRVLLTSDNPRFEDPAAILDQVLAGLQRPAAAEVMADRRAAIAHAVRSAQRGDVLLLAGKGHEDYQDVAGAKRPFSDLAEAAAALRQRQAASVGAAT